MRVFLPTALLMLASCSISDSKTVLDCNGRITTSLEGKEHSFLIDTNLIYKKYTLHMINVENKESSDFVVCSASNDVVVFQYSSCEDSAQKKGRLNLNNGDLFFQLQTPNGLAKALLKCKKIEPLK